MTIPPWAQAWLFENRDRLPVDAGEVRLGILGSGQYPNYQYRNGTGEIIRRHGRTHRFAGFGSYNPKHLSGLIDLAL